MTEFTHDQMGIVEYCALECERQRSGEFSVYNMVHAWLYAMMFKQSRMNVKIDDIALYGQLVEPLKNWQGIRTSKIYVGDGFGYIEKMQPERIHMALAQLLDSYYDGSLRPMHPLAVTSEDQFYYDFENIHPFMDGNGRTGKILYNYLRDTLEKPAMPPNFWGSSNP